MNIVLIGYRGVGKTVVGKELAGRLGLPFYDTDALIEQQADQSIQEIVAGSGWEALRRREQDVIRKLCGERETVIATGGGAVLNSENVALLKQGGLLVWLVADEQTVMKRMQADDDNLLRRPSLTGEDPITETSNIMRQRLPFYRDAADWCVETSGKSVAQIVAEICAQLALREK